MKMSWQVALPCLLLCSLGMVTPSVAAPSYCADATYANSGACFASNPTYCADATYANSGACSGSRPTYCAGATYADSRACSGRRRPSMTKVFDAAGEMELPIAAESLVKELMK